MYVWWFAWTEQSIKDVVVMLTDNIVNLGEVIQRIHGRNLCFYRGEATTKSIFAALLEKNLSALELELTWQHSETHKNGLEIEYTKDSSSNKDRKEISR
jgi:hypothetical protein